MFLSYLKIEVSEVGVPRRKHCLAPFFRVTLNDADVNLMEVIDRTRNRETQENKENGRLEFQSRVANVMVSFLGKRQFRSFRMNQSLSLLSICSSFVIQLPGNQEMNKMRTLSHK